MTAGKRKWLIPLGITLLGLVMITLGVFRGEVQSVWTKAVNVCLECIGIG